MQEQQGRRLAFGLGLQEGLRIGFGLKFSSELLRGNVIATDRIIKLTSYFVYNSF